MPTIPRPPRDMASPSNSEYFTPTEETSPPRLHQQHQPQQQSHPQRHPPPRRFQRATSVNAAVDFFESKSRSAPTTSSARGSRRQSVSSVRSGKSIGDATAVERMERSSARPTHSFPVSRIPLPSSPARISLGLNVSHGSHGPNGVSRIPSPKDPPVRRDASTGEFGRRNRQASVTSTSSLTSLSTSVGITYSGSTSSIGSSVLRHVKRSSEEDGGLSHSHYGRMVDTTPVAGPSTVRSPRRSTTSWPSSNSALASASQMDSPEAGRSRRSSNTTTTTTPRTSPVKPPSTYRFPGGSYERRGSISPQSSPHPISPSRLPISTQLRSPPHRPPEPHSPGLQSPRSSIPVAISVSRSSLDKPLKEQHRISPAKHRSRSSRGSVRSAHEALGSRRTSYRLSGSSSSRSSGSSSVDKITSPLMSMSGTFAPARSPGYDTQHVPIAPETEPVGHRPSIPVTAERGDAMPETAALESVVVDDEEDQEQDDHASNLPRPPHIKIPPRQSSFSSPDPSPLNALPTVSPKSPKIQTRKSSIEAMAPQAAIPDLPSLPVSQSTSDSLRDSRRGSNEVLLGEAVAPKHSWAGKMRPKRSSKRPSTSTGVVDRASPWTSPGMSSGMAQGMSPPRFGHEKRPPALTMETPPNENGNRRLPSPAGPSPPIPAKNPLRRLGRQSPNFPPSAFGSSGFAKDDSTLVSTPTIMENPSPPKAGTPGLYRTDGKGETDGTDRLTINGDEMRFPTLTVPSMYSQDSAPSTATSWTRTEASYEATNEDEDAPISPATAMERQAEHPVEDKSEMRVRRQSTMDDLWGKSRSARSSGDDQDQRAGRGVSKGAIPRADEIKVVLPILNVTNQGTVPQITDSPLTSTNNTATTTSDTSRQAIMGHSPISPLDEPAKSIRSPSAPLLNNGMSAPAKAAKLLGISTTPSRSAIRTGTDPTPLLPSVMTRSPTTPALTPRTPSTASVTSKRVHLIREIAQTERAYATDLALVRDAYLVRLTRSPPSNGDHAPAAWRRDSNVTENGQRNSVTGGTDWSTTPITSPHQRSSYAEGGLEEYFSPSLMTATTSVTSVSSFSTTTQPSPKDSARSSMVASGSMGPPIGKPLSPADLRAVFLNLDQLAQAAEELATAFESAMGDDDGGGAGNKREGDVGNDRLGDVFTIMIPRLRPAYNYYCARQSGASARLVELQADPAHAAYLNECWGQIRGLTHAWNLDSMLIKPVQRITKYPLLFEDLLACTTPVHPDYFTIRSAAETARSVAVEIDESKRRKDLVASAISAKKSPPIMSMSRDTSRTKGGLKLFGKGKSSTSISSSNTSVGITSIEFGLLPEIPKGSLMLLKELAARVDEGHQVVKRVAKEVLRWTDAARQILEAEDVMMVTWTRVVQLDAIDAPDDRIEALRSVLKSIVTQVWAVMNNEVQLSILHALTKLQNASYNPRKVIAKRDSKLADYSRYITSREKSRSFDKTMVQSARDFVALHTQLMDELPTFLEGYSRIFDMTLAAFAKVQATYYAGVRVRLEEFTKRWIARPRKTPRINLNPADKQHDLSTGKGIVKEWHSTWGPNADAMENFNITRSSRNVPMRLTLFNSRPGSRTDAPTLRQSPSLNSPAMSETSSIQTRSDTSRQRSATLLGTTTQPSATNTSPNRESRFSILSTSKSSSKEASTPRNSRPTSLHIPMPDLSNRYSFALPKVSPLAGVFDGMSPQRGAATFGGGSRAMTDPTRYSEIEMEVPDVYLQTENGARTERHVVKRSSGIEGVDGFGRRPNGTEQGGRMSNAGLGLGLSDVETGNGETASRRQRSGRSSKKSIKEALAATLGPSTVASGSGSLERSGMTRHRPAPPPPQGSGQMDNGDGRTLSSPMETRGATRESRGSRGSRQDVIDASEGWRNEPVLYQCACVAEFNPREWGDVRYRGLAFLPMTYGDLFEILHEVGRIDELPKFPYPEIGVDNDGVLVGKGEDGSIGLLICSFLEPLRE